MQTFEIVFFADANGSIDDPRNERHVFTRQQQDAMPAVGTVFFAAEQANGGGIAEWTATPIRGVGELRVSHAGRQRFAQVRFWLA